MLQLQRPPVLLLRAHAAYKTSLWKLQPLFRTRGDPGERLAVNKLSFSGRRFTPVGEGGSGRRPLPPQSLNILIGLTLKLLSLYRIVGLV